MRQLILGVCLVGAVGIVTGAQDPVSQSFEVATIKLNKSGDLRQLIQRQPGGRITVTNMPVRMLITFAHLAAAFFSWLAVRRGCPLTASTWSRRWRAIRRRSYLASGPDPIMLAMRDAAPADRFMLRLHHESREMDIYALVLAKPGAVPGLAVSHPPPIAWRSRRRAVVARRLVRPDHRRPARRSAA